MNESQLLVPTPRTTLEQAAMKSVHEAVVALQRNGWHNHATVTIFIQGSQVVTRITDTPVFKIVVKPE